MEALNVYDFGASGNGIADGTDQPEAIYPDSCHIAIEQAAGANHHYPALQCGSD